MSSEGTTTNSNNDGDNAQSSETTNCNDTHNGILTCQVDLPTGRLGIAFISDTDDFPGHLLVTKVARFSRLREQVKEGYVLLSMILGDGTVYRSGEPQFLVDKIAQSSEDPHRKMIFGMGHPDLLFGDIMASDDGQGIVIGRNDQGKPVITHVDPRLRQYHNFQVGMVVLNVLQDDSYEVTGGSAEVLTHAIMSRRSHCEVVMQHPENHLPALEILDPRETRATTRILNKSATTMNLEPPMLWEYP